MDARAGHGRRQICRCKVLRTLEYKPGLTSNGANPSLDAFRCALTGASGAGVGPGGLELGTGWGKGGSGTRDFVMFIFTLTLSTLPSAPAANGL